MSKAIIVGASSGIGLEVARLFIQRGWTVGVAARRLDLLQTIGAADVEQIDVTSADAPDKLMQLVERLGGMDLFFYASGIGKQNRELTPDIELATVETNGLGFTRMIGCAYRYFAQQGMGTYRCYHLYRWYQRTWSGTSLFGNQSHAECVSAGFRAAGQRPKARYQVYRYPSWFCGYGPVEWYVPLSHDAEATGCGTRDCECHRTS